jgi:NAD(P)H-hydrate epimerase
MTAWDRAAHERYGIPPLLLMENAAQAAVAVLEACLALDAGSRVIVVMGRGNNGGDGAAVARILRDKGCDARLYATCSPDALPGPAREHVALALALGVPLYRHDDTPDADADLAALCGLPPGSDPRVVVDALTGTGIRGDLRERELALVRLMNSYRGRSFLFALDIPSGLSGLTGKPMPDAVRADATVCFEAGKPGLYMPGAAEFTGEIHLRRVGIPLELRLTQPASWQRITPQPGEWAKPSPFSHKGSAGKVLIIGGSAGMIGAPCLAARGSLRAGAGLAYVALPGALAATAQGILPEAVYCPIGQDSHWRGEHREPLIDLMARLAPDAVVVGPGMGREEAMPGLLRALLELPNRPPLLLDADALFFFALPDGEDLSLPDGEDLALPDGENLSLPDREDDPDAPLISLLQERDILTPHPGEMARMLPNSALKILSGQDTSSGEAAAPGRTARSQGFPSRVALVQHNRPQTLALFTEACPATLALKGAGTLVGRRGAPVALSPFSVAALGVGGSGDVLSGVIAALVASGLDSRDAACLGVYLHGRAGELLSRASLRGHLAREIADAVPQAWEELCS